MVLIRSTILLCLLAAGASGPARTQTSVTLYTDGRVVVRGVVAIRIPPGRSTITVPLREPDPSTLIALDPGVHVVRVRFPGAESDATLLQRSVGRQIQFLRPGGRDTVSARVISADPLRLQLPSGGITLGMLGQPIYPRDVLGSRDSVEVVVDASRAVDRFRFAYQTVGAAWRARYTIRLGSPRAAISGSALLSSSLLDIDSAEVQLYAGQVGSIAPIRTARGYALLENESAGLRSMISAAPLDPASQTIGSHRLYSLPGRYRLVSGEIILVPLFQPLELSVERILLVEASGPIGPSSPGTPGHEVPIQIQFRAERPKGSDFGDRSLPAGVVSIYDGAPGRETLVGEGRIGHLTANYPFLVDAGGAFDVKAFRSTSGFQMVQDSLLNPNGSMVVRTTAQVQSFDWTMTNAGDSAVTVEVVERRTGKWRVVQSSSPAETIDGGMRFRMTVPARGEGKLTFRVRFDQ